MLVHSMMEVSMENQRMKTLLTDTITLLCKNGLSFQENFTIEATIGITVDYKNVMIVSINELVNTMTAQNVKPLDEQDTSQLNSESELSSESERKPSGDPSPAQNGPREKKRNHSEPIEITSYSYSEQTLPIKYEQKSPAPSDVDIDDNLLYIKEECPDQPDEWGGEPSSTAVDSPSYIQPQGSKDSGLLVRLNPDVLPSSMDQDPTGRNFSAIKSPSKRKFQVTCNQETEDVEWPWVGNDSGVAGHGTHAHQSSSRQSSKSHSKERSLVCHFCRESFPNYEAMVHHRALVHTDKLPYTHFCPECGKGFTCLGNLKGHMNSIHLDKPFQCVHCGNQYGYKHHLQRHIRNSHGPEIPMVLLPNVGDEQSS